MERYRTFTDEKTGVNPFVPLWSNYSETIPTKILRYTRSLLLTPIFGTLVLISHLLFVILPPIKFISSILACMILASLRIYPKIKPATERRLLSVRLKSQPKKLTQALQKYKPILISNLTAPTDILIYHTHHQINLFAFPHQDGTLTVMNPKQAYNFTLKPNTLKNSGQIPNIQQLARKYPKSTVVVFPEGQKSNGTAILSWKQIGLDNNDINHDFLKNRLAICAIQHEASSSASYSYSPCLTTPASFFSYYLNLLSINSLIIPVNVSYLIGEDVTAVVNHIKSAEKKKSPTNEPKINNEHTLRLIMSRAAQIPPISSKSEQLAQFNKQWNNK